MESLLQGIPGVSVYIDNILVMGKSITDHLKNLEVVLSRLEEPGVKLKRDKCSFLLPSVEFLGHHVSAKGVQPTTQKVDAIHRAPKPKDITQPKSFLGAVNYYGKFLPDLSTVLSPLYQLFQKNTRWSPQDKTFKTVKALLTSDKVTMILPRSWTGLRRVSI